MSKTEAGCGLYQNYFLKKRARNGGNRFILILIVLEIPNINIQFVAPVHTLGHIIYILPRKINLKNEAQHVIQW